MLLNCAKLSRATGFSRPYISAIKEVPPLISSATTTRTPTNMINNMPMTLDQIRVAAPAAFAPVAAPEMSDRYSHVTTANLVTALMDDGWKVVQADQARARKETTREHGKHRIVLTHPELPEHREGRPQMYIGNAGNGTSAVRLMGGFLRFACLNQNYAGVKVVGGVFFHAGAALEDRIVAGARNLRANFDKVISKYDLWNQIDLSPEQQASFAREAMALRWPNLAVDSVDLMAVAMTPQRSEDGGSSLWKTYNRVQERVIKGRFHARFTEVDELGNARTFDRNVRKITGLTASERINTGLWELASELASPAPAPALALV